MAALVWMTWDSVTPGRSASDRSARGLPHREKYPRLVNGFLRDFLELHDELSDDVEREQS